MRKYRYLSARFFTELRETTNRELFERVARTLTDDQYRKWLVVRRVLTSGPIQPGETSTELLARFYAVQRAGACTR